MKGAADSSCGLRTLIESFDTGEMKSITYQDMIFMGPSPHCLSVGKAERGTVALCRVQRDLSQSQPTTSFSQGI